MGFQTVRTENFPRIFPEKKISKKKPLSLPPLPGQVPCPGDKKKAVQGRSLKMKPLREKVSMEGRLVIICYFCTCA